MKQLKAKYGKRKTKRRQATTLSEVLVSIMILSIGIISLATLFPISILRSLQASQLTNATILRFNAESQVEVTPSLIYDPDGDSNFNEHHSSSYLVDPLGIANSVGNLSMTTPTILSLARFPGLTAFDPATNPTTAEPDAITAVTLPDSWVFQLEGTGVREDTGGNASTTDFTFDEVTAAELQEVSTGREIDSDGSGTFNGSEVDRNGNGIFDVAESRIVLFDISGRYSQVRTITAISGQTVSWSGAINYVVGTARIETAETRYTWMLTVRNNSVGLASVDVVVFFRRAFSPEDNKVHRATFISGNRKVGIIQDSSDPVIKKGGFVLDVQNALWYRIQDIQPGTGGYTHFLEIERPADVGAGEDINLNGALDDPPEDFDGMGDLDFGGAVFMQGVVEVYPLGVK